MIPRPNLPGAEVRAAFAAKREALRRAPAGMMPTKSSKARKTTKGSTSRTKA